MATILENSEAAKRLLYDFFYGDFRLGSHPRLSARTYWRDSGGHPSIGESTPPSSIRREHPPEESLSTDESREWSNRLETRRSELCASLLAECWKDGVWVSHQNTSTSPDGEDFSYFIQTSPLLDGRRLVGALQVEALNLDLDAKRKNASSVLLSTLLVHLRRHASQARPTASTRAVGAALRQIRKACDLSLGNMSERLGLRVDFLDRCESGVQALSADVLMMWCNALEVTSTSATRVEIVDVSRDLIASIAKDSRILNELTPDRFEVLVAERLDRMGFDVRLTGSTNAKDGGIDLIAVPKTRSLGGYLLAGQVKHHHSRSVPTGRAAVDRLLAWMNSDFRLGLLVTNSYFSKDALWAAAQPQSRAFLRLRDFHDLKRWIIDDFSRDAEWQELPEQIKLAPGIVIKVPRPELTDLESVSPTFRVK